MRIKRMSRRVRSGSRPLRAPRQPVLVRWLDIVTYAGWNEDLVEEGKDQPAEFLTVGYIVNNTKEKLTISDTANAIGNITTFPKGCVLEITELQIKTGDDNVKKTRKRNQSSGADNE